MELFEMPAERGRLRVRCKGGPADGWAFCTPVRPCERIGVMEPVAAIGVRLGSRFMAVPADMAGASVYVRDRWDPQDGRSIRVYVPEKEEPQ